MSGRSSTVKRLLAEQMLTLHSCSGMDAVVELMDKDALETAVAGAMEDASAAFGE